MTLLLFLATLPALYWAQPVETAPRVRQAGLERLCVPPETAAAWRAAGFTVVPLGEKERSARTKLTPPGLRSRADVASATVRPWVDANGWRFLRTPGGRYWGDVPAGQAALAAAEAFAYGADVVLAIDPEDLDAFSRMLAFLSSVPDSALPAAADIAVVDDGSPPVAEILNLMARRNLLFAVVRKEAPDVALNVRLGSKEFPRKEARNPEAFALAVRRRLTDERRSLRLYGSEVVLARLTRGDGHARLHLLNYGGRTIDGLRVRLLGSWAPVEARVFGQDRMAVEDLVDRRRRDRVLAGAARPLRGRRSPGRELTSDRAAQGPQGPTRTSVQPPCGFGRKKNASVSGERSRNARDQSRPWTKRTSSRASPSVALAVRTATLRMPGTGRPVRGSRMWAYVTPSSSKKRA